MTPHASSSRARVVLVCAESAFRQAFADALDRADIDVATCRSMHEALRTLAPRAGWQLVLIEAPPSFAPDFDEQVSHLCEFTGAEQAVLLRDHAPPSAAPAPRCVAWDKELGIGAMVERVAMLTQHIQAQATSAPPPAQALERYLAPLKQAYMAQLPERIEALSAQVHQLSVVSEPSGVAEGVVPTLAPGWSDARRLAHNLHGTAGSHGLDLVSAAAGRLEDAIELLQAAKVEAHREYALHQAQLALQDLRIAATVSEGHSERAPLVSVAKVLVCIHTPQVQQKLRRLAAALLFELQFVESLEEAVGLAQHSLPDAALIELVDGGPSVLALGKRLRGLPGAHDLPLALIAPSLDLQTQADAALLGAHVLLQSEHLESLRDTLRALVQQRERQRPRVLLVDDDDDFIRFINAALTSAGMNVHALAKPDTLDEVLAQVDPDLILLDVMLPGESGFDLCRRLRAHKRWQTVPILFLTARTDPATRMATFEAGADDYLAKPIVAEELLTRVRLRLERLRLLRELADRDPLSGLIARPAFLAALERRLEEARRRSTGLCLALLDIDRFKQLNDTHGHAAGDRVIQGLGQLLTQRFRVYDLRGRWGSDEFVLAFPGEQAATIRRVLQATLEEFQSQHFTDARGRHFHTAFSAGVATFPDDGASAQILLEIAGQRLFLGKRKGPGRIV
ncbi:MAG: diguanylate cyclase [Polyangiales bacterium]